MRCTFSHGHGTCDQLSDLHICSFPQQADQSRNPAAVLQGNFVLIVGLAVHQVPQGSAGATVNLTHPVVQKVDQQLDASLSADLRIKEAVALKDARKT